MSDILTQATKTVKHKERDQWILVAFERCGRVWANSRVPCIHSDPLLPDADAGKRVSVMGRLWFYEGKDVDREVRRARDLLSPRTRGILLYTGLGWLFSDVKHRLAVGACRWR